VSKAKKKPSRVELQAEINALLREFCLILANGTGRNEMAEFDEKGNSRSLSNCEWLARRNDFELQKLQDRDSAKKGKGKCHHGGERNLPVD
jgi:hypothetical protein